MGKSIRAAVIHRILPAEFTSQFQGVQVQVLELQLLHRGRPGTARRTRGSRLGWPLLIWELGKPVEGVL